MAATRTRELAPAELAALEEERDFLLTSLQDLEEEHAAGDVDEDDYTTLRDDYTTRAATVLRAIESHSVRLARPAKAPARPLWQRLAVVGGVAVFALGAGLLVREASGRRGMGDTLTGNIRESSDSQFSEALLLGREGRFTEAIEIYDEILADDPDNVQAATYRAWNLALSGNREDGLAGLVDAARLDPDYPDVHALLAVMFSRIGQPDAARQALARLDELNPPAEILAMVEGLRAELNATPSTTVP